MGESRRKPFWYNPSNRLYLSAIAKKIILDFLLLLDVFWSSFQNLLYVRNSLKRRSGSTERLTLYCHKQRLMYCRLRKQQTRTFHRLVKGSGPDALVRVTGLEPARA